MRSAARTPLGRLAIVARNRRSRARRHGPHRARAWAPRQARSPTTSPTSAARPARRTRSSRRSSIGAINTQGGQVLVGPGWTNGVKTAVQYVNKYLGGVQGPPARRQLLLHHLRGGRRNEVRPAVRERQADQGRRVRRGRRRQPVVLRGARQQEADRRRRRAAPGRRAAEERLRALRDERLRARPVGHARQGRPPREDGGGRLHRRSPGSTTARRSRRRASSRPGSRRRWSASPPTATDLTGPLTAAGAQNADMIVPQSQRGRLRQRRQGARAAREEQHAGRLEPALPRSGRSRRVSAATWRSGSTASPRRSASTRPTRRCRRSSRA